jgi:hypothetical protein
MTSIYNINSNNCFIPSGSVLAYIGSSSVDPPGWVIANGSARTNSTIYNGLVTLSIGSRDGNGIYTPPNLNAAFLRGNGTNGNYVGSTLLTQQSHALQNHTHTASQPAHSHTTNPPSNTGDGTSSSFAYGLVKCVGPNNYPANSVTEDSTTNADNYDMNVDYYAGLLIKDETPGIAVYENTNTYSNASETRPFSYGVVWIIKL